MKFHQWLLFSARSRDGWKSWWALLITLPWVVGSCALIVQSHHEVAVARRQQITGGLITAHDRANHDQYRYTFFLHNQSYEGESSSLADNTSVGSRVPVYFDPQNPKVNSLEDFSRSASTELAPLYLTIPGIIAVIAAVLYLKAKARTRQSQAHRHQLQ